MNSFIWIAFDNVQNLVDLVGSAAPWIVFEK